MNNILIKEAQPKDAFQILEYVKAIGSESDNMTFGAEGMPITVEEEVKYIQSMLEDSKSVFYLAWDGEKIVGDGSLRSLPRRMGHRGSLGLAIRKEYWNKGIGSAILGEIIEFAKEHHIDVINLEVRSDNEAAIHLYEKFGFKRIGISPAYCKVGEEYVDFMLMYLDLRRKIEVIDVYKDCSEYENENYILRMVKSEDTKDLLKVYSDIQAVPFFNSDNCGGDNFYYSTESRMMQAIEYWLWEYSRRGFVRWVILSKATNEAIGTIELFHRDANDYFTNCGLLRLDIRSDYETSSEIVKILQLIIPPTYRLFHCDKIATKAIPSAIERISALESMGFKHSEEKLIGHDGTNYDSYYVLESDTL